MSIPVTNKQGELLYNNPSFIDMNKDGQITDKARCIKASYEEGVTNHKGSSSAVCIPVITPDRINKRQNGRRFKDDMEDAFTLNTQDRHGVGLGIADKDKECYHDEDKIIEEFMNEVDTEHADGIYVQISEELIVYAIWYEKYECYIAIRRLTPRECFRLQGWEDKYFERAEFVCSNSQLYRQAGNGVTVPVIETIARKL